MADPNSSNRKLRILCLHGYSQNAEVFRSKTGSLRKALKSQCEFFFIDAPYLEQGINRDGAIGRSWWQWKETAPGVRPSVADKYVGWDLSTQAIERALCEHGEMDGILGFSQGATATALYLTSMIGRHFKFAIIIAGFLPKDVTYAKQLRDSRLEIPTLFIHGKSDDVVPLERNLMLQETFQENSATSYQHEGGHCVPTCGGTFKKVVLDFISTATVE